MRLLLRHGTREVLLFSRNRFVRFDSPRNAGDFLAEYLLAADNLERLRNALAQSSEFNWLARRDEVTVLDRVAEMMSRGIIKLMSDPDNLTPWAWRFDSPTFPKATAGAEFESSPLVQEADETGEQENEIEDPIPVPVVPPTFIVVAAQEAGAILDENRLYELALDMLRYVGLGSEGESEVAPTYGEVEAKQTSAINEITDSYAASLGPLAEGGLNPQAPSEISQMYPQLSASQKKAIEGEAQAAGEALAALLEGGDDGPPDSQVAPGLHSEAKLQIAAVTEITAQAMQTLDGLAQPDMPQLPPPTVAESLREGANLQADQLFPLTAAAGEALLAANGPAGDPPPKEGEIMVALRLGGEAQGKRITELTVKTAAKMTEAITAPAAQPAPDGQVGAMFRITSALQSEAINNQIAEMGGGMALMAEAKPLPIQNASLISEVFIGQADEQRDSLVGGAETASDGLARLVGAGRPRA